MKKLSKNQSIGVFVAIVVAGFLLFGGQFFSLFNPDNNQTLNEQASTGVKIEDVVNGQGTVAEPGDTITVHYVGKLTNGQVFDSSIDRNQPFVFELGVGKVIRGWDQGFTGMRVGGKRILTISPDYAYGNQAIGPIPANSTLIFEVQLLNVQKTPVK